MKPVLTQDEILIKRMLEYLEDMTDEGPPCARWKSAELQALIRQAYERLKGDE